MYAILHTRWAEIKNCEEFTKIYSSGKTYIKRIVGDWMTRIVYETIQEAKPKEGEWTELQITEAHGPYTSEASMKTAISKLKKQMREN